MGFHIVKCRGQKQLSENVSLSDGLALEKQFFESTDPWRKQQENEMKTIREESVPRGHS